MNLGLYKAKFWFRKFIDFMLPYCKDIDPNLISYAVLPIGLLSGITLYYSNQFFNLYLVTIVVLFLRMIVATLDGYVAQHYNKSTEKGEIINKYTPEVCDFFLMIGLILPNSEYYLIGLFVLIVSWAISFFGMIGHMIGRGGESIGPLGQTDRVVTVMVFCFLQYLSNIYGWKIDFIYYFLVWHVIGGTLTVLIRLSKTIKKCDPV